MSSIFNLNLLMENENTEFNKLSAPPVFFKDLIEIEEEELEDDGDFLQRLFAEPEMGKKQSMVYSYEAAKLDNSKQAKVDENNAEVVEVEVVTRKCTCSKTRCQKNYCECFKLGFACTQFCECTSCGNREQLFRAPEGPTYQMFKCKCSKSHCMKNYCECHNNGRKCGKQCKCTQCHNKPEVIDSFEDAVPQKKVKSALSLDEFIDQVILSTNATI